MFNLENIQTALKQFGFDGWLLYDFRGSNVLALRVLQIAPDDVGSRRLFYYIPAEGSPKKLVHRIESEALDHLPGDKEVYLTWQALEEGVRLITSGVKTIAMEYSPRNVNPYISRVDAGTIELVKSFGLEIQSSGDLIQLFEATWDESQWQMHQTAAKNCVDAFAVAWNFIAQQVREKGTVRETIVQDLIMQHFAEKGMTTYHPPIIGVGPHSGDPHYAPQVGADAEIKEGDFVLIDLWAKLDQPRAVYADYTRVGFVGENVPPEYQDIFKIVAAARDAAIKFVRDAFRQNKVIHGWEVDQVTRAVIEKQGYGDYFVHRTGHNIGQETHGNGANIDNLETKDGRRLLPNTCFSIEPGIYLAEFGARSEVNVYIDNDAKVHVTGGPLQSEVLPILAEF